MKNLLFALTILAVSDSQARSPMPHKPYRTAVMEVTSASGEFTQSDSVKLTEWSYPRLNHSQDLQVGNL